MILEENIRRVVPYTPGDQPKVEKLIKLNTNECPYPPAPGIKGVLEQFDVDKLRRYPNTTAKPLTQALASYYGLEENQVFVGVGSDDVLAMIFMTFFNSGKPIIFPDITYSFYDVWAELLRIPYELKPLNDGFEIEPEDYECENGGVIFPNPNAPTGALLPLDIVEEIIKKNQKVLVVVDEAYIDFGGQSAVDLIHKYENLMVVQTFSKSRALAGSRIGYAMGNEKLIQLLNDVKFSFNSYTMDQITQVVGVEAIKDDAYFKEIVGKIVATREWASIELRALGFSFKESYSNFVFVTHESVPAKEIYEKLKEKNIFVRYFNKPRIDNYLRITIGTDEEMKQLIKELKEILA